MDLNGLDLKTNAPDLEEGASPDTTNAFFYGGKYGMLGARQGKTCFNSTAYDGRIKGLIKSRFGNQLKWLIADTTGQIVPVSSALGTDVTPAWTYNLHRVPLASALSLTVTYPSTTGTTSSLFMGGQTLKPMLANETLFCDFTACNLSVTGGSAMDQTDAQIYLGVVVGGTNYFDSSATLALYTGEDVLTRACGMTFTSGVGYIMSRVYYNNGLSGQAIQGLCLKIDITWGSAASGGSAYIQGVTLGGVA